MLAVVALVALVSPLVPGATSDWDLLELGLDVGPDMVRVDLQTEWSNDLAASLRASLDGDHDGRVSQEEVFAFEDGATHPGNDTSLECLEGFAGILLDSTPPRSLGPQRVRLAGAEGSVASQEPIVVVTELGFRYAPGASDQRWLAVDLSSISPMQLEFGCSAAPLTSMARVYSGNMWTDAVVHASAAQPLRFEPETALPPQLRSLWSSTGFQSHDPETNSRLSEGPARIRFASAPAAAGQASTVMGGTSDATMEYVLVAAAIGAAAFLAARHLRRWPLLPLFSRITRAKCLDHPSRELLLEAIRQQPGLCLADLRRVTGLGHATSLHHLAILQAHGLVTARRSHGRARFFLEEAGRLQPTRVSRPQGLVAAKLAELGPSGAQTIADALGISRRLAAHHLRRLCDAGLVAAERIGLQHSYRLVQTTPHVDPERNPSLASSSPSALVTGGLETT